MSAFLLGLILALLPTQIYERADSLFNHDKYMEAASLVNSSLPEIRNSGNEGLLADCLSVLANSCTRLGIFDLALQAQQECYELDRKSGDPSLISSSLNSLAGIYLSLNNFEEAETLIRDAIEIEEKLGESKPLAIRYGMLSEILTKQKRYGEAEHYALEAFRIDSEAGRTEKAAIRQSQLADCYIETGQLDKAWNIVQEAFPVFEAGNNVHSMAYCREQQGKIAEKRGNLYMAANYLREAYRLCDQTGNMLMKRSLAGQLSRLLRDADPAFALTYAEEASALGDTVFQETTARQMAEFRMKYDMAGKEHELEVHRLRERNNRALLVLLIFIQVLLLVGCLILLRLNSIRKKNNDMLQKALEIKDKVISIGEAHTTLEEKHEEMKTVVEALSELGGEPAVRLTKREMEVARLCAEGLLSKEIADRLGISQRTVEAHKNNIFRKLNINTTAELVEIIQRDGVTAG